MCTNRSRLSTLITAVFLAAIALPVWAHHSAAMFEDRVVLTLSGTVSKFDYVNPHAWLYVNVENEDGTVTVWGFELEAQTRLRRLGIPPSFWREGDRVTVRTRPLKDGRPAGSLVGALTDDGKSFGNTAGIQAGP
jgi:hypothetical protein